jgi:hypothetical protein
VAVCQPAGSRRQLQLGFAIRRCEASEQLVKQLTAPVRMVGVTDERVIGRLDR